MTYNQHVGTKDMKSCLGTVRHLMGQLKPGFLLLTDLSNLGSMEESCAPELGAIMDLCSARGMLAVVRVIPDPGKDIGFDLISRFHHHPPVKTQIYENLAEAINSFLSEPFDAAELRQRAETRLKTQRKPSSPIQTEAETKRLLHELQVHQIELEMQNVEIQQSRDKLETLLGTYTDLYDFAPVGYFSVDEQGLILQVNLTGAALLGLERSRLINRPLQSFVDPSGRTIFRDFFKNIFANTGKKICEIPLLNERSIPFWADIQAAPTVPIKGAKKWCRMSISNVTSLKQEEEVRKRLEHLAATNLQLKQEMAELQKAKAGSKVKQN